MKKIIALSAVAFLSTALYANSDVQTQIDELKAEITKLKKGHSGTKKSLSGVKKATGGDNVKFGIDFRNTVENINYKYNDYSTSAYKKSDGTVVPAKDISGTESGNDALLTSRLYLTMAAAPMQGLIFKGKLAIYSTWGSHLYVQDAPLKDWSSNSKPADSVMRVKEAYFVYSNSLGSQPISFSVGRRPASNGFLANYRENEANAGSPLAHITNMEVNAAMVKLSWDRFLEGSYTKFVYGRAHTGEMQNVYSAGGGAPYGPYATISDDSQDRNVDFALALGDAYNDGQYQVMYQWAHILNTKGKNVATGVVKGDAGTADLASVGLKVEGIGDEISDFLDDTIFFISGGYTNYTAANDHTLMGSDDGGSQDGSSLWTGIIIPDGFSESGKFGFEYNQGSKYWTPMTWAEDSAMGSKIAVRGSAYEAYWNFNLFGAKYLPSQIRYTYMQHDYTPNINCAGWVTPVKVDIEAQDIRLAVSYRY